MLPFGSRRVPAYRPRLPLGSQLMPTCWPRIGSSPSSLPRMRTTPEHFEAMRAATSALVNYINMLRAEPDAQAIVADCYTFTLLTGLILTYTSADVPVTLNGYVFAANSILVDGLKFKCAAGLEVDQQQITVSARATN